MRAAKYVRMVFEISGIVNAEKDDHALKKMERKEWRLERTAAEEQCRSKTRQHVRATEVNSSEITRSTFPVKAAYAIQDPMKV